MKKDVISFNIKIDNTDLVKEGAEEAIKKALYSIGTHIEGEAKEELENDPRRIDTGLLRNSITFALSGEKPQIDYYRADNPKKALSKESIGMYVGTAPNDPEDKKAVYIGTNISYAPYVHEGVPRRKMAPNRFLKNAVERNKDQLQDYVKQEFDKLG